jgi:hypothetical protein
MANSAARKPIICLAVHQSHASHTWIYGRYQGAELHAVMKVQDPMQAIDIEPHRKERREPAGTSRTQPFF